MFAIAVAKYWGAKKIIAIGGTQEHIVLAKKAGADAVINRHEADVIDAIKKETSSEGVDVVLEMAGVQTSIEQGLKVLKPGGQITLLGLPAQKVNVDWSKDIVLKDITIRGIYGREIPRTWDFMKELFADKRFDISPIVTHKFRLEEFEKAVQVMKEGKCGKVVLLP